MVNVSAEKLNLRLKVRLDGSARAIVKCAGVRAVGLFKSGSLFMQRTLNFFLVR